MEKSSNGFSTLSQALDDLRAGKMIIVTDDPNRENEGDLICAAEFATTGNVNFMATYGKGLICMPMSKEIANKLALPQMVSENTDNHCTAFTVSIDHIDTTTGISAVERGITARKIVDENSKVVVTKDDVGDLVKVNVSVTNGDIAKDVSFYKEK